MLTREQADEIVRASIAAVSGGEAGGERLRIPVSHPASVLQPVAGVEEVADQALLRRARVGMVAVLPAD